MVSHLYLGPQHPQVVVASRVFDEWWEGYQPVAYLSETILDEVPTGIDPNTIWTEFHGEYEEYNSPGLQDSGRNDDVYRRFSPDEQTVSFLGDISQLCKRRKD